MAPLLSHGVSTLNAGDRSVTSNIVPNHGDSKVDAFAQGTQIILDISSYFAP